MKDDLDEATATVIVDGVRSGLAWPVAAALAGVSRETFRDWEKRGEQGEEAFKTLLDRLEVAEAELEMELLSAIRAAATNGERGAAVWLATRRFPHLAKGAR